MDDPAESTMDVMEHLNELRVRLMKMILALALCTLALMPFAKDIFEFFTLPLLSSLPQGTSFLSVSVTSPVLTPLKVTLFCAFCLSLPYALTQIWAFAAPGLYKNEKKIFLSFVLSSLLMFALGVCYCYAVVFKLVFEFIGSFAPDSISFAPDVDSYISFVLHMFTAFGLSFEIPVGVLILHSCKILNLTALKKGRPYVIVAAFAVSAVLTPPDVLSQFLLAVPIILLYELSIVLSVLLHPSREPGRQLQHL